MWGVVAAALTMAGAGRAVAQAPNPAAAIAAARDAKAKTEAAQKKNSEALDPQRGAAPALAQPASPQPAASKPPQGAEAGYSYDPQGRRDPFVSLLGRGTDLPSSTGARPAGLPGLLINEVTLKGVLKSSKGDFLALLQAPDNRTYIVRSGDKVMDGSVKAITQEAVVFSQDVNDPLSLVKQREVRKTIRPEAR